MNRHRTDLVSLSFGLFFAAVAGWWALSTYLEPRFEVNVPNLGWIAAGALILIGLLGVAASLRSDRRAALPPPTVEPAGAEPAGAQEPTAYQGPEDREPDDHEPEYQGPEHQEPEDREPDEPRP